MASTAGGASWAAPGTIEPNTTTPQTPLTSMTVGGGGAYYMAFWTFTVDVDSEVTVDSAASLAAGRVGMDVAVGSSYESAWYLMGVTGSGYSDLKASFPVPVQAGIDYYVILYAYAPVTGDTFAVSLTATPLPTLEYGDNVVALVDMNDAWVDWPPSWWVKYFTFTAPLSLTATLDTALTANTTQTGIDVIDGQDGFGEYLFWDNGSDNVNGKAAVSFAVEAGHVYHIALWALEASVGDVFTLTLSDSRTLGDPFASGYRYASMGSVETPTNYTPLSGRSPVRTVHVALPAPTLVDGRPT